MNRRQRWIRFTVGFLADLVVATLLLRLSSRLLPHRPQLWMLVCAATVLALLAPFAENLFVRWNERSSGD